MTSQPIPPTKHEQNAPSGSDDDVDDADHSSAQATGFARVSPATRASAEVVVVDTHAFVAGGVVVVLVVVDVEERVWLAVRSSDNAREKGWGGTQAFTFGRVP